MISRIEARHYRALRWIDRDVGRFHVLVGPNASGKSTFLDVVAFLGDLVQQGLSTAVFGDRLTVQRAPDAQHLLWMRQGDRFELAVEMPIPPERKDKLKNGGHAACRYEVGVSASSELRLLAETLWLKPAPADTAPEQPPFDFPRAPRSGASLLHAAGRKPEGWKRVVSRGEDPWNVTFSAETSGWNNPFRIGPAKSALASLPEDEVKFPVATWVKQELTAGLQRIALASDAMRRPSPPGRPRGFVPDGSNLPWVVERLEREHVDRHRRWLEHVREALPDVAEITTREREEDRHRYLVIRYRNGLEAPSWLVSDGTLRLLALTLLAYAPDLSGIYLIEEPENGLHPRAIEVVMQSLSSVPGAQVLCATHAPMVLSVVKAAEALCFARDAEGATDIVAGDQHPRLREWKGEVDLGTLFASGVLG